MLDRLQILEDKYEELNQKMVDPDVLNNPSELNSKNGMQTAYHFIFYRTNPRYTVQCVSGGCLYRERKKLSVSRCYSTWLKNSFVLSCCGFSNISAGVPSSAITPSTINSTLSETSRAKPISWVTITIVIP